MEDNIYFDGEDWIHVSGDVCLVYHQKNVNFKSLCSHNIPVYTMMYTPKRGDIVLDVGSGAGEEIWLFSSYVGESGHVYAIEADPTLHAKNLKTVDIMGLTNVTCINAAIMDKAGSVDIGVFTKERVNSSIHIEGAKQIFTAEALSLDDIFEKYGIEYANYAKINIEGAEVQALQGISDVSRIKNWCISTHDFCGIPTKEFVMNFFTSKGLPVEVHPEVKDRPWDGGHVYVTIPIEGGI